MGVSERRRRKDRAIRQLAWFHRWLGLATCVIFALWFASGAVLLFQPFPALSRSGQLALAQAVDTAALRITPAQALAAAGRAGQDAATLRLVQRAGRPAYLVDAAAAGLVVIDGVTGRPLDPLPATAARLAGAAVWREGVRVTGPFAHDQWVVHNRFDPLRPFYRLDQSDAAGTRLYLSAVSGQVVQRTTAQERAWNWVGAVLHWAYFTPIRARFAVWDNGVWWLSLVCLLVAMAGMVLGVVHMLAARRLPRPALTFYRRAWMRWHHLLGLFTGLFVLTWMASGWLSMDHGRLFARGTASAAQTRAYAGAPLAQGLAAIGLAPVRRAGPFREMAFAMVGGRLVTTTWDAAGQAMPPPGLPQAIAAAVQAAWPGGPAPRIAPVPANAFYAQAEGWPEGTLLATDPAGRRPDLAIDGRDGQVLTVLDASRKRYAWVYYALHTWRFPGLSAVPWLRQGLVLVVMLAGLAFSITGVAVAWRRLRRSL